MNILNISIAHMSSQGAHETVAESERAAIIDLQNGESGVEQQGDVSARPGSDRNAMRTAMRVDDERQFIALIRGD